MVSKTGTQPSKNALKQRAYRAKKKAEALQQEAASIPDSGGDQEMDGGAGMDENYLDVSVEIPEGFTQEEPKLSFAERMKAKFAGASTQEAAPAKRRRGGRRKKDDNALLEMLPAVTAGFLCTHARNLLPDEYKACAPTDFEMGAIIGPLFKILSRRVEVATELGEDATDLIASMLAGIAYGMRAYIVYIDIKMKKENNPHGTEIENEYAPGSNISGIGRRRRQDTPATGNGFIRRADIQVDADNEQSYTEGYATESGRGDESDLDPDILAARSLMGSALKRDAQYRRDKGIV